MRGIHLLSTVLVLIVTGISASKAQTRPDFLIAEVSDPTPYVGETLIYTVQWFSDLDAPALEGAEFVRPDYAGFGLGDETVENSTTRIDNRRYNVLTIRTAITPLVSGTLTLSPFRLVVPGSPFQEELSITSNAVTVDVGLLPANAPSAYVNSVGSFEAELATPSETAITGQPITLKLTVTGSGNLPQMLPPPYEVGQGWQIADTDSTLEMRSLLIGTRIFQWTLIPLRSNASPLPSVEFAAFDPDTGSYTVQTLAPSSIAITGNPLDTQPAVTLRNEEPSMGAVMWRNTMVTNQPILVPAPFWFLWLIPPVVVLIFGFQLRLREKVVQGTTLSSKPHRLVEELRLLSVENPKHAHEKIAALARSYRAQYVAQEPKPDLLEQVDEIIQHADEGQYAPVTSADAVALRTQLARLIQETSRS